MSLTLHQVVLAQSTFSILQPMTATAAALFYKRLFEIDPAVADLFKGEMQQQGRRFRVGRALRKMAAFPPNLAPN